MNFRKITAIAIALITMVMWCTVSATAADASKVLTFAVADDGNAIVTDCDNSASGIIAIPSKVTLNGLPYNVKYIGEKAFDGCYSITEISIPEGVTAIKSHAFRDCISLKDLYIPKSLVICQYDAFDGCDTVTVHCYTSNYQFFTVFGISANIEVDILDGDSILDEDSDTDADAGSDSTNYINVFVNALKNFINRILELFNAQENDFDFEAFLPFEIPDEFAALL